MIHPEIVQAAVDAFYLAISENKEVRESVIAALEAADARRYRAYLQIIAKTFRKAA